MYISQMWIEMTRKLLDWLVSLVGELCISQTKHFLSTITPEFHDVLIHVSDESSSIPLLYDAKGIREPQSSYHREGISFWDYN